MNNEIAARRIKYLFATIIFIVIVLLSNIGSSMSPVLRIRVIFDNIHYAAQLGSAWGFSCIVEGLEQVILFDTGADGNLLLANMEKIRFDPKNVGAVFLSHIHGDHVGGLKVFLQQNPRVTVYLPASFPASFKKSITAMGSEVQALAKPKKLFDKVYTSGEFGTWIKEQSMIIDTPQGLVIITGCAHPGVVRIASATKNWLQKEVYLLMGGFHLGGQSLAELQRVGEELKKLGVKKVAPSHCTGEAARKLFRELWGENFIESGVGAVIELQL